VQVFIADPAAVEMVLSSGKPEFGKFRVRSWNNGMVFRACAGKAKDFLSQVAEKEIRYL
jgi:hypothetical protein